ncbi:MAG TPA: GAF and ANTAR domain-containing protein [Pseudonocardiaceae bacterium]|jgi:hypothetical protein|nr:GAF and ANTAR domain-containing protein [Pseudonocardiaceae bacterium]
MDGSQVRVVTLEALAPHFGELTRVLLNAITVADVLDRITTVALDLVPAADLASITLRAADGSYHTPVLTDPLAEELDQIQYDTGEGPCVEAARDPGPASSVCEDLSTALEWPRFGPAAAALGMRSVLAVALLPDARPPQLTGALNLYSRERNGLTPADRDIALLLATHGSLALATTQALTRAELHAAQLLAAVESRDIIGQAKGILMHRRGLTADQAFELLRHTSQGMNVKLADLARTLATRHLELDLP